MNITFFRIFLVDAQDYKVTTIAIISSSLNKKRDKVCSVLCSLYLPTKHVNPRNNLVWSF